MIDAIPEGRVVSVERETFPGLLEAGAIVLGYIDNVVLAGCRYAGRLRPGSADIVTACARVARAARPAG